MSLRWLRIAGWLLFAGGLASLAMVWANLGIVRSAFVSSTMESLPPKRDFTLDEVYFSASRSSREIGRVHAPIGCATIFLGLGGLVLGLVPPAPKSRSHPDERRNH